MPNTISPDQFSEKRQHLAFLYLAKEEFSEAIRFAGALLNKNWVIDGGEHASPEVKALDIALVVTYTRPFKKNYGFGKVKPLLERAMHSYSNQKYELHNRIINIRDHEYAHADSEANDVQVHFDEMFEFSKRVTREPLQPFDIRVLIEMCRNLIASIDEQIEECRSALNNANSDI
jgi:hypothetical protein